MSREYLAMLLGVGGDAVEGIVADPASGGWVKAVGRTLVRAERFLAYKKLLKTLLDEFHAKNPLKIGISREELRTRLPEAEALIFQAALEDVVGEGVVEIEKDRVKLRSAAARPDQSRLETEILGILDKRGLTPPAMGEIAGGAADKRRARAGPVRKTRLRREGRQGKGRHVLQREADRGIKEDRKGVPHPEERDVPGGRQGGARFVQKVHDPAARIPG